MSPMTDKKHIMCIFVAPAWFPLTLSQTSVELIYSTAAAKADHLFVVVSNQC